LSSAALGAAIGGAVLLVTAALFAAVFGTYVLGVAQGLREAASVAAYLASSSARLTMIKVNGSKLEAWLNNTGSTVFTVGPGAVLIVRYVSGGVERLETLPYGANWSVDNLTVAGLPQPLPAGGALALEPGAAAHIVATLRWAPDPSTLVVAVYASPEGVVARGTGSA